MPARLTLARFTFGRVHARWRWPVFFVLLALPLGVFLALRVPPGHVPDERNHVLRAESLLHGAWIGERGMQDGHPVSGVLADEAIARVITDPISGVFGQPAPWTSGMRRQAAEIPWNTGPAFAEAGSVAGYMPPTYLPGALAIFGARLTGGGPLTAFLAMRLANLLCFLLLGGAALRWATTGRALIAAILLLPMTLSLAASCSQDGLLIAMMALATACLMRARLHPRPSRSRPFLAACLLLAVVICGKPPYAPLGLLLGLPLRRSDATELSRRAVAILLAILPALGWMVAELAIVATPIVRGLAEAGPLWPGSRPALFPGPDFKAQFRVLSAAPWRVITLPLISIAGELRLRLREMIGELDYLSLMLPAMFYHLWDVSLAAASLEAGTDEASWPDRLLIGVAIVLSICLVGTALYIQWTPVGMPWVAGIQGRYLLPLLPLLALGMPRLPLGRAAPFLAAAPLAVGVIELVWLPPVIAAFYPLVP